MKKATKIEGIVLDRLKLVKNKMKPRDGRGFVSLSEAISRLIDFYEVNHREGV